MKIEMWKKLEMSFAACGVTALEVAEAMKRIGTKINEVEEFRMRYEREARHRRRCVLIARALSKAPNREVKRILWKLFLNT